MLDEKIERKLESLSHLPAIPYVINEVLSALDNPDLNANYLAKLIERDQMLTARVLTVANSPFYGFSRRIATIDLAIVVLGFNSIREIVLSFLLQRFLAGVRKDIFDVKSYWNYSMFCGAASRVLARKLGYRLAGEAFVAGLMHDIGIIIIVQFMTDKFIKIRQLQNKMGLSIFEAEQELLNSDHCGVGAWFADRWNLPEQLRKALQFHHNTFSEVKMLDESNEDYKSDVEGIEQPLTLIVSLAEWFSMDMGFKVWSLEVRQPTLYMAEDIVEDMRDHEMLNPESALELLKQEILEEFQNVSVLNKMTVKPLF
jgi:HD-like signal output (HDOD) protein